MNLKLAFKKFCLVLIKTLLNVVYAVVLIATCFGVSVWFSSPVVLLYVTVMQGLEKAIPFFNGTILYLWASVTAVIFVPLLIYSIVYRIRQRIKSEKAIQEALEKAKAEGEKKDKKD